MGKKRPHQKSAQPKTHHEILSRPATATNSRLRAAKHVLRGSPYSNVSSIDPGFVEISLACIHAHPHCCCCVACICFGILFSGQRSFFCFFYCVTYTRYVCYMCISGSGAVRWCLTLSFPRVRSIRRLDVHCTAARGVFSAAAASGSRQQRSAVCGMRHNVQNNKQYGAETK